MNRFRKQNSILVVIVLLLGVISIFALTFKRAYAFYVATISTSTVSIDGQAPFAMFDIGDNVKRILSSSVTDFRPVNGEGIPDFWNTSWTLANSPESQANIYLYANGTYVVEGGCNINVYLNPNSANMFRNLSSLKNVNVITDISTGGGDSCYQNLSDRYVTNMDHLFANTTNLTSLNVQSWTLENVVSMNFAFSYTNKLATLNTSNFRGGNVVYAADAFYMANAITSGLNLYNFNTSKLQNAASMFMAIHTGSLNVTGWDVRNVKDMSGTFYTANVTSLNLSTWNTHNVTNMYSMFKGINTFNENDYALDLRGSFNIINVVNMESMFENLNYHGKNLVLTSENSSDGWESSIGLITTRRMFSRANILYIKNLSQFPTSTVRDMGSMFESATVSLNACSGIRSCVASWNVSHLNNAADMFYGNVILVNTSNGITNLSDWDTSNLEFAEFMFAGASLGNLNLSTWNTQRISNIAYMFYQSDLLTLNMAGWKLSSLGTRREYVANVFVVPSGGSGVYLNNFVSPMAMRSAGNAINLPTGRVYRRSGATTNYTTISSSMPANTVFNWYH